MDCLPLEIINAPAMPPLPNPLACQPNADQVAVDSASFSSSVAGAMALIFAAQAVPAKART